MSTFWTVVKLEEGFERNQSLVLAPAQQLFDGHKLGDLEFIGEFSSRGWSNCYFQVLTDLGEGVDVYRLEVSPGPDEMGRARVVYADTERYRYHVSAAVEQEGVHLALSLISTLPDLSRLGVRTGWLTNSEMEKLWKKCWRRVRPL